MPKKVCKCEFCRGYRNMMVVTTVSALDAGRRKVTRELVCPACDERRPFGVCCPACGDCRFSVRKTYHRDDGATVRLKQCRHCRHRIRATERISCASA